MKTKKLHYYRWMNLGVTVTIVTMLLITTLTPIVIANNKPNEDKDDNQIIYRFDTIENHEDDTDTITLGFSFDVPTITEKKIDGKLYHSVSMLGLSSYSDPGKPILPVKPATILLPYGKTVDTIIVSPGKRILLQNDITIEPGQKEYPIGINSEQIAITHPDPLIYSSQNPYPDNLYDVVSLQQCRGYTIIIVNLFPLQYVPASNTIFLYEDITIFVNLVQDNTMNALFRGFDEDLALISQKVDNPEIIEKYPQLQIFDADDTYDLLILTTDELKDGFLPLKSAHDAEGNPTVIKTLTDIGSNDREDIRNYIRDAYLNWGIDYVLIGGDSNVFPVRNLLGNYNGPPSDLYYACLDGTYNFDGDSMWGEPTDGDGGGDVDLMAEVYVGRAPVDNIEDVEHFVTKTVAYMNTDDVYLNQCIMVGQSLNPWTFGGDYMDEMIDGCNDSGYTTVGIPSDQYMISKLYDRDWPGFNPFPGSLETGWPKSELLNRSNNGVHVINHMGHGNNFHVMKLDEPVVMRGGVINGSCHDVMENMTNTQYFFVYSQACYAGAFDNKTFGIYPPDVPYDCIAEYLTVKSDHGAVACIMNARYGYYSPGETNGPSQRFNREFWDAVFGENISEIGRANQDSKEDNIYRINQPVMRIVCYGLNLFGDPMLTFSKARLTSDANGPYIGYVGQPIQFNGTAYGGIYPYTFFWDFGDGNFSYGQYVYHQYTQMGEYAVTLNVTDSIGNITSNVTTVNVTMNANTNGPYEGLMDEQIHFNGSIDGGIEPYNWSWNFGDNNISYEQNPVHDYPCSGIYIINLTVIDSIGNIAIDITNAGIFEPEPLIANIDGPSEGYVNSSIGFTGSATGGLPPYTFAWDFDGDGYIDTEYESTHHQFLYEGIYLVNLTVTDNRSVTAQNTSLVIIYSYLTAYMDNPSRVIVNTSVIFSGLSTGGKPPYVFEWDFDGDWKTDATGESTSYIFNETGYYYVHLTVTDNLSHHISDTSNVYVRYPLIADVGGPYEDIVGVPIPFSGSATGGFYPYIYEWDFDGDGETDAIGKSVLHSFNDTDEYLVTLTVIDSENNTDTNCTTAIISEGIDTTYVDDDYTEDIDGWGIDHFDNIQNAINVTANEGIVIVNSGLYDAVVVDRFVNLIGQDKETTIIDGDNDIAVYIELSNLFMSGFTIKNGLVGVACLSHSASNSIITDIIIEDTYYGIYIGQDTSHCDIFQNTIINCSIGIILEGGARDIHPAGASNNNSIYQNTIRGGIDGLFGMAVCGDDNTIFHNNLFHDADNTAYMNAYNCGNDNIWYNETLQEGNYWDDFEDNPGYPDVYEIPPDGSNIDKFPLDAPFGSLPDLVIADFSAEYLSETPTHISAEHNSHATIKLTATIKNNGTADIITPFQVTFYGINEQIDAGFICIISVEILSLDAGDSTEAIIFWKVQPEIRILKVFADSNYVIEESDEKNNWALLHI